jgi:molecular chaperone DnaK
MRQRLDAAVEQARTALRGDDVSAINSAADNLARVYSEAGQAFYQQQNQQQQGAPSGAEAGAQENAQQPNPDNVVEADYEIVDDEKK